MADSPSFFDRLNTWARRSVTLKLLIIGVMILFLLIPATMLDGLIFDRQQLRDSAQQEVAAKWGTDQVVGGPVISVPYSYNTLSTDGKTAVSNSGYAHFLPDVIEVDGQLDPQERYRGIFVVVLYNTTLEIKGNFGGFNAAALNIPAGALQWKDALFTIGITDMTGVQAAIDLTLADTTLSLGPGTVTKEIFRSGASVPIALTGQESDLDFRFDLNLNGSSSLYFRPFGKQTNVSISGGWANPSFDGGFLPKEREVTPAGFTASWEVLQLNRNYPQQGTGSYLPNDQPGNLNGSWQGEYTGYENAGDLFGLRLLLPVDEYQKTYRSTNFAILFIFITFLTFFFIEVLNKRRVHPIQYLLIGAAIILFYVLLLSISEHLLFDAAYWISCAAIVSLITMYSWFILRNRKLTLMVAAILLILYIFFYSLLQLQDYALLFGSLGLLLILGAIMWLTRNIDWYELNQE